MNTRMMFSDRTKDECIDRIVELEDENELLRAEIARLKKLPEKPTIKPNAVIKEKQPREKGISGKQPKKLIPTEIVELRIPELPPGTREHGWKEYIYQELVIDVKVVKLNRKRYRYADGTVHTAPLPEAVRGWHFGPQLRQYILHQHHKNNRPLLKL